jgi:protein-tyrosine-phosphatase
MSDPKSLITAHRIIAICWGNTCRSPFLAEYLQLAAHRAGLQLPPILSRGISKHEGGSSSDIAITSADKFSVNLRAHRSQSIFAETSRPEDIYLLVDPNHAQELLAWTDGSADRFIFVGQFDPAEPSATIADPYGGDAETYDRTYARIQRSCDGLLAAITLSH